MRTNNTQWIFSVSAPHVSCTIHSATSQCRWRTKVRLRIFLDRPAMMLIPPGNTSVSVEEICQPQFEDLELDIPGGDSERTLNDVVHGIILWPKRYIIIPQTEGSIPPTDPPQS
jgi:hypothetical protein